MIHSFWKYRIVAIGLLFAYAIGMVGLEPIHHLGHSHDHSIHHTEEAEADACHRAIFHGDLSLGCEHKSHVHKTEVDCELCDVITNRVDQVIHSVSNEIFDSENIPQNLELRIVPSSIANKANRDRGPPTV